MRRDDEVDELVVQNLSNDAEKSTFENGYSQSVALNGMTVVRATLEPGWGVATVEDESPNDEYCQRSHYIFVVSGTLGLELDDGTETEIASGSGAAIPPGHRGWTVGDEDLVYLEFQRQIPSAVE